MSDAKMAKSCGQCRWFSLLDDDDDEPHYGRCTYMVVLPACALPLERLSVYDSEGSDCQVFTPKQTFEDDEAYYQALAKAFRAGMA